MASSILLIGIRSAKDLTTDLTTDVAKRDQSRVEALKKEFGTVFTLSRDLGDYDEDHDDYPNQDFKVPFSLFPSFSLSLFLSFALFLFRSVPYKCEI